MFSRYNNILLGAIFFASLVVAYFAATIQPFDGDLTRIGGYNEKDFGWQLPQKSFKEDYLFKIAHSLQDYDQHFDVVVLGDSFTLRPGISWANYFIATTGLSIISFHHRDVSAEEIVRSPQFLNNLPTLFIYQSSERSVVNRLARVGYAQQQAAVATKPLAQVRVKRISYAMELRQRQTEYENLTLRVSEAIHTLKTKIVNKVSSVVPRTIILPLRDPGKHLFSCRNQTDILVYRDAIAVREGWKSHWQDAIAGYRNLRALVEKTGGTNLATLVFPDKLTVYADYLANDQWRGNSVIPVLAEVQNLPRLDLRYKEAVAQGMIDVYLPDNTHTSSAANEIAVRELLDHLRQRGVLQR